MNCAVCIEPLRRQAECPGCNYQVCIKCTKRYILSLETPVKCMNCKVPWSRKTIVNMCGDSFVNTTYKRRREEILFDLETALMPEANDEAIIYKKDSDMRKLVTIRTSEAKNIEREVRNIRGSADFFALGDDLAVARYKETMDMMAVHDEKIREIHFLEFKIQTLRGSRSRTKSTPIRQNMVIMCPGEDCRGFVDSVTSKCGMCDLTICNKCHEPNGDEHTCDPATVETIDMIKKDTRNCPKCKVLIHKIVGCNQMFCVQCKTPFSWTTGEVILGVVHNPHYFEYLQQNPNAELRREIGDIPCGGLPEPSYFRRKIITDEASLVILMNALRICHHIENHEIPSYQRNINYIDNNRHLRIKYLANELTLKDFKRQIQIREKAREKFTEITTILNTCIVVASDIFRRMLAQTGGPLLINELMTIRQFTNSAMMDVSKVYKCVVPEIRESWQVIDKISWQYANAVTRDAES